MGCDGDTREKEKEVDGDASSTTMFQRAVSHAKEFIEASPEDHKK